MILFPVFQQNAEQKTGIFATQRNTNSQFEDIYFFSVREKPE